MYRPEHMPAPIRAASAAAEAEQHPLLRYYLRHTRQGSFFQGGEGMVASMDEAAIRQMRATYYGMMTELDDHLGRVLDLLDATDRWRDTLVVFTSDHGEQLGDHYLLGKIGYHDESFRIPLVIVDPTAEHTRGTIVDAPTESVDVMPTLLSWIGAETPDACDGRSLAPLVHGDVPADWRDALHYEFDFRDTPNSKPEGELGIGMDESTLCVLQDADFKYVHFTVLPPLLFDLRKDPDQFRNVAEHPDYISVVRDYAQKMLSWRMRHADRTLTHYHASPQGLVRRANSHGDDTWPTSDAAAS
jgi:arylsulfatase A-like enzyme